MPETVRVLRIEGRDGKGLFSSCARYEGTRDWPDYPSSMYSPPTPHNEGLPMTFEHYCGFSDFDQMLRWIGEALPRLAELPFFLCEYEVPYEEVHVGIWQIIFRPARARCTARLPLKEVV